MMRMRPFVAMVLAWALLAAAGPLPATDGIADFDERELEMHMDPFRLEQYRGSNRLVLLFTPRWIDSDFQRYRRALDRESDELSERDIMVLVITGDTVLPEDARGASLAVTGTGESRDRLLDHFTIRPGDSRVVLVGKDGGQKGVWTFRNSVWDLFRAIDHMPMRREEVRQKRREARLDPDSDPESPGAGTGR